MQLLPLQKNVYGTNFHILLCTYNVLEYLKTDTSKNGTYSQQTVQFAQQTVSLYTSLHLTLYVSCIMFQCVDKQTRCNTSYE